MSENPSYSLSSQTLANSSNFSSPFYYDETLDISPSAKIFCEILNNNNNNNTEDIEKLLSSCGVKPSIRVVEEVLKFSYNFPKSAIVFFKWTGPHWSARVFDIFIDLVGSNGLFKEMWGAIDSMKDLKILSENTFVSVFRNFCGAGFVDDAIRAFQNMEMYGVRRNIGVLNSLLSEICKGSGGVVKAFEFFGKVKGEFELNLGTYTVLMEGLEREKDVSKARVLFSEMVEKIGWCNGNVAVYDAFLITLFRGGEIDEAVEFVRVMKGKKCFPGLRFFSEAFEILHKKNELVKTLPLWDIMVGNGVFPNVGMFNAIIGLFCKNNNVDSALRFLDEMVMYGAFPDSVTYNTIFRCLVKNKKVREASRFFTEMTKNECPPSHLNCAAAIALFFEGDDPEMAVEIWHYMLNNRVLPFEESANMLLIGLCNLGRLTELKRFVEKMLDRNIHISVATWTKIKQDCLKRGGNAVEIYDSLSRKWKSSQ